MSRAEANREGIGGFTINKAREYASVLLMDPIANFHYLRDLYNDGNEGNVTSSEGSKSAVQIARWLGALGPNQRTPAYESYLRYIVEGDKRGYANRLCEGWLKWMVGGPQAREWDTKLPVPSLPPLLFPKTVMIPHVTYVKRLDNPRGTMTMLEAVQGRDNDGQQRLIVRLSQLHSGGEQSSLTFRTLITQDAEGSMASSPYDYNEVPDDYDWTSFAPEPGTLTCVVAVGIK